MSNKLGQKVQMAFSLRVSFAFVIFFCVCENGNYINANASYIYGFAQSEQ